NFEWFLNLLRQFEQEQEYSLISNSNEKHFLDIHLYFTEIKNDGNIRNVSLDLVTKIYLIDYLMPGENASTANDVSVFFCKPSTMSRTIQNYCAKFRFRFYEEKF
ncbi:unnamed protein product, partial [Rotaria sp. Silwood2]